MTKAKMVKVSLLIFLAVVFVIFRPRGWGVVLGEPDEFIYMKLAESWRTARWPLYGGQPFYYDLPLFTISAAALSFLKVSYLQAVRWISYVAVFLTAFVLYSFRRKTEGSLYKALLTALFFLLTPLTVFYSQIGVLDPYSTLWLLAALVFFCLARRTERVPLFLLAGVFLGLALLTKYTALVLLALIFFHFVVKSLQLTLAGRWREKWRLDWGSGLTLFIAVVLFLPPLFLYRLKDPWVFLVQTGSIFGWHGETAFVLFPRQLAVLPEWFNLVNLDYWWTLPFLVLVFLGLSANLYRRRETFFLLTFGFYLYLILGRVPFHIRYLFPLLPFFSWFAVDGLYLLSLKKGKIFLLLSLLLITYLTPKASTAWQSSRHDLLERSVAAVKLPRRDFSGFVFANYWPNFYGFLARTEKASWLATNKREVEAFYPAADTDSFTLLSREGGYVFLEDFYARFIVHPPARAEAAERLETIRQPFLTVEDTAPNFPFLRGKLNQVEIYQIEKGEVL